MAAAINSRHVARANSGSAVNGRFFDLLRKADAKGMAVMVTVAV